MPYYDLRCEKCHSEHNIHGSMTEKTEKRIPCPSCGSFELETVFKAAPAVIKGGAAPCPQRSSCGARCPHGV